MKFIYIAGSYSRREELKEYALELQKYGFHITSSWLWTDSEGEYMATWAKIDLKDLEMADTLLFFNENEESGYQTGGRHVEFGVALATGKHILTISKHHLDYRIENIFHHLLEGCNYASWNLFMEDIKRIRTRKE